MTAIWAIIKLTCRDALRSYVFQLLLVVLLACIILVPNTISGDGTASGFIQISLKYSLGFVSFILSLSTIWLGSFSLTRDVETYQLHMVISKPVSRGAVWAGKFLGVMLLNLSLLIISCSVIYGFIIWQYKHQKFTAEEKSRIENEVMVGRKVFVPVMPNIKELTREEYKNRLAKAKAEGTPMPEARTAEEQKKILTELRKQILANMAEVKAGEIKMWEYRNIPSGLTTPLFMRYRAYLGKVSSQDQRETGGIWAAEIAVSKDELLKNGQKLPEDSPAVQRIFVPRTPYPEKIMSGSFHEIAMTPKVINQDGVVRIGFQNFDAEGKSLFFQAGDGPLLLLRKCGFFENYWRGVLVIMLRLFVLCGLSCAAASCLSMPTAIFMVISYLSFGSAADFLIGLDSAMEGMPMRDFSEIIASWVSRALLLVIIPMQKFEISGMLANGELVEFYLIGWLFLKYVLLRGMPLFLLGLWLYKRRELGLIVRK
ncbi:MAG: hypothetical protein A2X49_04370 [Lentisphaerae bacterium GWF2_52_8]|nr:MAG: hypothetical protein A2X49_04370 [Lentisphaerae bacterium GWF2_52_8]